MPSVQVNFPEDEWQRLVDLSFSLRLSKRATIRHALAVLASPEPPKTPEPATVTVLPDPSIVRPLERHEVTPRFKK